MEVGSNARPAKTKTRTEAAQEGSWDARPALHPNRSSMDELPDIEAINKAFDALRETGNPEELHDAFGIQRPMYYRRDGSPIFGTESDPDWHQFAVLFEDFNYRIVGNSRTLYRERLSTVWLGIDHNFSMNLLAVPRIFETMLFAPVTYEERRADLKGEGSLKFKLFKWLYPDDGRFQLRYASEAQALAGHKRARRQCLIPPPLRRFILYTIMRDDTWS